MIHHTEILIAHVDDYRLTWKQIKLPTFYGDDPINLVSRVEAYFVVQGTPPKL